MSLDQAREYLARVLPWSEEGPQSYGNVHYTFLPKDLQPGRKLPWTGRAGRTVADAIKGLEFALKSPDTRDIYACLSTQREAQEVTAAKGWTYLKPVRLAENAVSLKSLFLDVDVKGGDTGYGSQQEAITSLGNFLKATALPKPSMIVGSGGGFHIYWVMTRALTVAEWYPLAAALVEATKRHGLKCDTAVTTDAARVLRIPGTLNYKTSPPRPVRIVGKPLPFDYTVEKLTKILEPFKVEGALPAHLVGFAPELERRTPLKASDLAAGIETAMPQAEIRACLDAIPNVNTDWAAWNSMGLRVFAACEGADYGLEEWQRWSDQVADEGKDSCESRWNTFQSSPPTRTGAGALVNAARVATGDPGWQARASPPVSVLPAGVGLAVTPQVTPAPQTPALDLPHGYSRDAQGIVWLIGLDDNGATTRQPISEYPLTDAWLQRDPPTLHFTSRTERGTTNKIVLLLEVVGTNEMRKILQSQGFMLRSNPKLTTEFFLSWIKKLQESKDTVSSQPFGWAATGGKLEGFVFGGTMYTPTGPRISAVPDRMLQKQYEPTGDVQPWRDAMSLITAQSRPDIETIVATAFGAPLVSLTGHKGLLVSAWSQESGVGKTTAMIVAQSVWGDPRRAMQGLSDTQNSLFTKLGMLQSLPMYWDEIKGDEAMKDFVNLTFRLTGGKDKSRLSQSIKLREVGLWNTIFVCCNNDSLLDYVVKNTSTTAAGLYRVFEFEVTPGVKGKIAASTATRLIARLDHNFGAAGAVYAEFLGSNIARIDKEVGAFQLALEKEVQPAEGERLWVGTIGAILLGATYANELGLASFDIPVMRSFLIEKLGEMREERNAQPVDMKVAMNVSDKLARFLNAMQQRHTITTNRVHITAGRPAPNSIKIVNDASKLDGIFVHVGREDKLLRISSTYLGEWLAQMGFSRHIFMGALEEEFGCKKVRGRIASGTSYAGATEYLLEIDMSGSPLLNFIDEA